MAYRVSVVFVCGLLAGACSSPEATIGVEEKFRGDTRSSLEIGDTPGDEANSSNESEASCIETWISDGWCDIQNNSEACSFDGGDCCPSTCEDSMYTCGDYQWICMDPGACENTGECEPAPDNIEVTYEEYCEMYPEFCDDTDDCEQFPELCDPELYCEMYPDNCITYEEYCGMYPEDPICDQYDGSGSSSAGCVASWSGDDQCDDLNNNDACGWDGGDCCASTCGGGASCNENDFVDSCLDPAACENTGEEPCEAPVSDFCMTNPEYCALYECFGLAEGDADLDVEDCWEAYYESIESAEEDDNSSASSSASGSTASESECIGDWISDGWCDIQNNSEACGWDGGDCCPSTCEDREYTCGDYQWICMDPEACESTGECEPAPDNVEITLEEYCEMYPEACYNQEDCEQYPELCDPELYCEMYPENCVTYQEYCEMFPEDPICESYDEGSAEEPSENEIDANGCLSEWIGDGWCDDLNNNDACGWDDGDCCASTCIDDPYNCTESFLNCQDPSACENTGEEPCEEPPSQFCITNPEYCAYYECLGQPDANPDACYEAAYGDDQ